MPKLHGRSLMKVRYLNFRKNGTDMTGKEVEMDDDEARVLINSNIVVPVERQPEMETASIEPPENAMVKRVKKDAIKSSQRG